MYKNTDKSYIKKASRTNMIYNETQTLKPALYVVETNKNKQTKFIHAYR